MHVCTHRLWRSDPPLPVSFTAWACWLAVLGVPGESWPLAPLFLQECRGFQMSTLLQLYFHMGAEPQTQVRLTQPARYFGCEYVGGSGQFLPHLGTANHSEQRTGLSLFSCAVCIPKPLGSRRGTGRITPLSAPPSFHLISPPPSFYFLCIPSRKCYPS